MTSLRILSSLVFRNMTIVLWLRDSSLLQESAACLLGVDVYAYSSARKMEVSISNETLLILYQTTFLDATVFSWFKLINLKLDQTKVLFTN